MADQDYVSGTMDVSDQRKTYERVMGFGSKHGVGLSMALALFFTMLLLDTGILAAMIGAFVCYLAIYWIVRLFFTH